jgi:hypothetical protein
MALFEIKNIKLPSLLKTNDEFKITGDVHLFGIPFIGPLWVDATIKFPSKTLAGIPVPEPLGTPTATATAIAIGGHFSFDFTSPTGFDREGDYKLDLNLYLGPETQVSLGGITSKNVSIPPFPPVASIPTATFTISGKGSTEAVSFQMGTLTINPSSVVNGQTTILTLPITNIGNQDQSGVTVKMEVYEMGWDDWANPGTKVGSQTFGPYTIAAEATQNVVYNWKANGANKGKWLVAAVYVNGVLSPNTDPTNPNIFKPQFEVTSISQSVSLNLLQPTGTPEPGVMGQNIVIKTPINCSSGPASLSIDIEVHMAESSILGGSGTELTVLNLTTTIASGQTINPTFNWTATGAVGSKDITVKVYDHATHTLLAGNSFDDAIHVNAVVSGGLQKVGSVTYGPTFQIGQLVAAMITVKNTSNSTITPQFQLQWKSNSGLDSYNDHLNPFITESIGAGQQSTFVIQAQAIPSSWSPGITISCQVILNGTNGAWDGPVTEGPVIASGTVPNQATLTANYSNGTVSFSFTGFTPNASIGLSINNVLPASYYVTANPNGAGNGSFTITGPSATYTLTAQDYSGKQASATYTIPTGGGGGGNPNLTANYSSGVLSFSFSGFQPNSQVFVYIDVTGGGISVDADNSGNGNGAFYDNDSTGWYTLVAYDSNGHQASTFVYVG